VLAGATRTAGIAGLIAPMRTLAPSAVAAGVARVAGIAGLIAPMRTLALSAVAAGVARVAGIAGLIAPIRTFAVSWMAGVGAFTGVEIIATLQSVFIAPERRGHFTLCVRWVQNRKRSD
jgi:hypothetical protein